MYAKFTVFAAMVAAVSAQGLPSELEPLLTAAPSDYQSIISSLTANGVTLPSGFPTDPAEVSSLAKEASAVTAALAAIPTDYMQRLESALNDVAPSAALSDIPAILSSAGPAIGSALGVPQEYMKSAIAQAPEELAALESHIPGSLALSAIPAYLSTASLGPAPVGGAKPTGYVASNGTASASGSGAGKPTSTAATSSPSGTSDSDAALSTGGAAGAQVVGWTGALAGVAMGAVAFL